MAMPRSDLPHVSRLDPKVAHEAVEAMGRAYDKAEGMETGISYTATWVEMLEAALSVLGDPPGRPWGVVTDRKAKP
jgi:hypothetical protein